MKSLRTKYYYALKYTIEHQRIINETIEKYKTTQFHIACEALDYRYTLIAFYRRYDTANFIILHITLQDI